MNYIQDIKLKNKDTYNVVVEIVKGTREKMELNDPLFCKLEEQFKMSKKYPYYYGCFPQTLAGDNDPLDMILLTNKKHSALDVVKVVPVGLIITSDYDKDDYKVLVKPVDEDINNIEKQMKSVMSFLTKVIAKNPNTIIDGNIYGVEDAINVINNSHSAYNKASVKPSIRISL